MRIQNVVFIITLSILGATHNRVSEGKRLGRLNNRSGLEGCCNELVFESSGSISGSGQEHVLGAYDYYGEGDDGTQVYKQVDGMFWDNYLFYMKYLGLWYIGQTPGENSGYEQSFIKKNI